MTREGKQMMTFKYNDLLLEDVGEPCVYKKCDSRLTTNVRTNIETGISETSNPSNPIKYRTYDQEISFFVCFL